MKYDKEKKQIILDKELGILDHLVIKFISILEKYCDYVIISGYVSILLGRSRATEDVDLFVRPISFHKFKLLYSELEENGFWCLNTDSEERAFNYLKSGSAIRFSETGQPLPNFEVKFPKDLLSEDTYNDFITVVMPQAKLKISSLERHIAFKRYFLGSKKDMEDALHIEEMFKDKIDCTKINKLKELIKRNEKQ